MKSGCGHRAFCRKCHDGSRFTVEEAAAASNRILPKASEIRLSISESDNGDGLDSNSNISIDEVHYSCK